MFGMNLWGSVATPAPGGELLNDRERNPPPRPIPLEFPSYIPSKCGRPLDARHMKSLCKHILSVRRPFDIQDSHLAQLNVELRQDIQLEDMTPDEDFRSRPFLFDADLNSMLNELGVENEDAYREILRLPPLEGRKKPRLAYSRNFYATLEEMCRYWDDSKDDYYEIESKETEDSASKDSSIKGEKKQSEGRDAPTKDASQENQTNVAQSPILTENAVGDRIRLNSETMEIPTRPRMKQVYKGARLGNGEQMSPGTRIAAIRNLLKMAVHKFNCRDYDVQPRERLRIGKINLPSTYYNFCVAKMPSDIKLARARMVEGPLLGVHCRTEVRFRSRDGLLEASSDFVGEKYDLFREVSGLLMLAQQRAREGRTPSNEPTPEQWWAVKSRWGDGPTKWGQLSTEVFEDDDPSWSPEERHLQLEKREREEEERQRVDLPTATDLNNLKPEDLISTKALPSSERPQKKKKSNDDTNIRDRTEYKDGKRLMYTAPLRRKWYQEWANVRPNSLTWDDKMIYKRIGMPDPQEGWDDVYMISGANHHACIVKLTVHKNYLEWLETGAVKQDGLTRTRQDVDPLSAVRQDHILYMSRSRWFDMFDTEQRKDLLTGIWRLLSWINRDEIPKAEYDRREELRRKQQ
ncbi:hypothetical protein LTR10_015541 [Elasticomyces elasticus]|uniref:ASX DEUBAD domain-containing protein n=1 Tax=Exophiala sideris TaxID=1016849 RepID=A0ABR0JKY7_9EURO|nr:hypothetical protein LTR10_015541 [Elasticomyces elasticus]KAK5032252.1 hypothetical protein LTR13_007470 [Exophiala sideris]KAK5036250.1 hypothetical protein LTS07_001976 [Exophiala sideris]KAK5066633.1 hypothetical protein LTR69_001980 [Exophiala sideris]KAK5180455.1 hypothetical protein LTR44_007213 [Eurotiomycetes sp. CCFEE 6388]